MQALTSLKQRIGPLPGSTLQARNARRQASWAAFKRGAHGTMRRPHSSGETGTRCHAETMPRGPNVPAPPHRRRRGLLRRFVRHARHSVMAEHNRPKGRRASHAYVAAIHVFSFTP